MFSNDKEATKETKYLYLRTRKDTHIETHRIKLVLVDHDCSQGISFI